MTDNTTPKYKDITISLVGNDGNAFSILARCKREMVRNNIGQKEIDEFMEEAKSGDYDHLLITVMKWFDVE